MNKSPFILPSNLEKYLATLSTLYAKRSLGEIQRIIVNAEISIDEGREYDNWNGGTSGHVIYLSVKDNLYLGISENIKSIEETIKKDLNELNRVDNEYVAAVNIELKVEKNKNWREESGLLVGEERKIDEDIKKRIWGGDGFRLFLSHKAEFKKETFKLKEELRSFGIHCFVAHQDIDPTLEWQIEIENALASMQGFVALMTEDFHDSKWTDQEVGYAIARNVPIISVRLGSDPYGFIGKFQALSASKETLAEKLIAILIKNPLVFDCYLERVKKCESWSHGNYLSKALVGIDKLTDKQIDDLIEIFNGNSELHGSFGFNGGKPREWGSGLMPILSKAGTREFIYENHEIKEKIY